MLLVPCAGQGRKVCGTCAWAVAESLATCGALERSYDNRNDPVPTALRQILHQHVRISTGQHVRIST
jgi:hypothetical protein